MLQNILNLLPGSLRETAALLPASVQASTEELRIREGRPLEVVYTGGYSFVSRKGTLCRDPKEACIPTREECSGVLELITNHSLYSFEEELRRGYITVAGGHRIGLAGRTVLEQGQVKLIRDVSGFNFRIAREVVGCGMTVLPLLVDACADRIHHTLVISPPQQGKTTLLRDLARLISYGQTTLTGLKGGMKVGIVDERSELAGCVRGVPRFDLGPRTDVMDGCPKAEGMMMMIRSMSPEVLVTDELGRPEDAWAVQEAVHAGIRVISSAHAGSMEDLRSRPGLKPLLDSGVFGRFVLLRKRQGVVGVEAVLDGEGRPVAPLYPTALFP